MGKWQNTQKFNRKFVLLPTQQKNGSCAMHRSRFFVYLCRSD